MRKTLLLTILSCTAIFFSSNTTILAMDHDAFTSSVTPSIQQKALIFPRCNEKPNFEKELTATFLDELNKITPLDTEKRKNYSDAILLEGSLTLSGISDNNLRQLWPHLLKLSWLEQLDLSNSGLTLIPGDISQFQYLSMLNLSGNDLKTFSFISENNMALTEIKLAKNNLEKVEIKVLSPTFTSLELQDNKITSLVLEALSLQKLNISDNPSTVIQATLFETLQNLTYLNMSRLYIGHIPEEIGLLTKLEELDISLNNLIKLPQSIINLIALRKLHAQRNDIMEAPVELSKAIHLNYLDLSYNNLHEVPQVILTLSELISLILANNPITEVLYLSCLPNLKTLNLNNTSITTLPSSSNITVYYGGTPLFTKEVQAHYREAQAYDSDDDYDGEISFDDDADSGEDYNSDEEDFLFLEDQA